LLRFLDVAEISTSSGGALQDVWLNENRVWWEKARRVMLVGPGGIDIASWMVCSESIRKN